MTANHLVTDTAIIGSGFIGRAWAISFARAGARVRLWDQAADETTGALAYIGGVLEDLARNDLLNGKTPASVLSLIAVASSMAEALAEATYVQENTPEVLATKIKVFEALDGLARAGCDTGEFNVSTFAVALYRTAQGQGALRRGASDQSALSDPGGGNRAFAMDEPRDG